MDEDGDDKDDCKRRTRNLSEKKRRDQFNLLLNELGTMVSPNNKKMDKSTVLRSTISFINNHNEITVRSRAHDVREDWKPAILSNEEFNYLVLEALDGFVMVFSAAGRIYYVSESVTSILGHNANDIVHRSIFDLTYEEDRPNLYGMLQNLSNVAHPMQTISSEGDIRFQCHLQRGTLDFQDETIYELVQFHGHFRSNMDPNENLSFQQDHDSRLLFVCTGRLCRPLVIRDVSLTDVNRNEFTSRHSLEWKFLFLDHRAPPIIGFLPFEVLGTSVYDYYHFDDLEKVVSCHEDLMQKGELTSCYYRFLTKGQQWIWLQTRFYITYHQWNSKPEFIVCTNHVISYADVTKKAKKETVEMDPVKESQTKTSDAKQDSSEEAVGRWSPSHTSEASVALGNCNQSIISQPQSVKSTATSVGSTQATVGTSSSAPTYWHALTSQVIYPISSSENASVSEEFKSSQPTQESQRTIDETTLLPQHGIGAQYLEPAPFVAAVGPQAVLPLPISTVPVIVYPDQTQIQEQLQRTHRELQQLIVRQQEELRQVKEQLLLARLGFLQPVMNVQDGYGNSVEMHQQQRLSTQILYEGASTRSPGYPQHEPLSHQPPSHQPPLHQPPLHQSPLHQPPSHQPPSHQPSSHQLSSHQRSTQHHSHHRHQQHQHSSSGERQNQNMRPNQHHRHHHNMPPQ